MDECRLLADACRGDMRCVNQNGGYLCVPRGQYTQQYTQDYQVQQEPFYPDTSDGFPDTFLPSRPRPAADPSYPIIRTSAQCVLGYALAEDGTCNGELTSDLWRRPADISGKFWDGKFCPAFDGVVELCQTSGIHLVCFFSPVFQM